MKKEVGGEEKESTFLLFYFSVLQINKNKSIKKREGNRER